MAMIRGGAIAKEIAGYTGKAVSRTFAAAAADQKKWDNIFGTLSQGLSLADKFAQGSAKKKDLQAYAEKEGLFYDKKSKSYYGTIEGVEGAESKHFSVSPAELAAMKTEGLVSEKSVHQMVTKDGALRSRFGTDETPEGTAWDAYAFQSISPAERLEQTKEKVRDTKGLFTQREIRRPDPLAKQEIPEMKRNLWQKFTSGVKQKVTDFQVGQWQKKQSRDFEKYQEKLHGDELTEISEHLEGGASRDAYQDRLDAKHEYEKNRPIFEKQERVQKEKDALIDKRLKAEEDRKLAEKKAKELSIQLEEKQKIAAARLKGSQVQDTKPYPEGVPKEPVGGWKNLGYYKKYNGR